MVIRTMHGDPLLLRPQLRRLAVQDCRCAVVISSKVHKRAVRRNRLRRLLHAHLRQRLEQRSDLAGQWLLVSLRPGSADADDPQLLEECDSLLNAAGLKR